MTLSHSPSIVTDGLVLYYDMNNTKKSFMGAPTTNLIPNPEASWNGSSFVLSYLYDATATHSLTYVPNVPNPINAAGVLRYYTGTTGYKYWAIRSNNVAASGNHTFSYYARISSGSNSNLGNSQLWRDTNVDKSVVGDWNPTLTTEWKRYIAYGNVATFLDYFPIHSGSLTGGITVDYCGFQLESGIVSSSWVNGSRSNTQAIKNLINSNNTITISSLTYASDNTFSFNGTSNYFNIDASSFNFSAAQTIIMVLKPNEADANRRNPYNQAFGGYGTITHEPDGLFNYYHGTNGGNSTPYQGSTSSMTVVQNETAMIAVTRGSSYVKWYKNGEFSSQTINSNHPAASSVNTISIGTGYVGNYSGNIYLVMLYNIELSASQIKRNFNVLRGRYGI